MGLKITLEMICYDFDGIMTDNRALVFEGGQEAVFVNRSDGWAVARIREMGITQIILSTEENPVVTARARKLQIPVLQGVSDKRALLIEKAAEKDCDLARIAYLGNDVNDFEAMQLVGLPVAPSDAHPAVLEIAKYITNAAGGAGVVREFYEKFVRTSDSE